MGQDVFLSLMKQALMTVLLLSAPALGVAILIGLGAVSYTHLRAHET